MGLPPVPNVLVAGATGVVGEELLDLLSSRAFPHGMLRLAGSERSAGRRIRYCGTDLEVEALDERSFSDIDLVFLAAGGEASRQWAPFAAERGAIVIDNSSAFRLDPAVPLIVPEVNPHALPAPAAGPAGAIIANPNCSTIIALMAATPIDAVAGVRRMVACTYQAASGGGRAMMEELEQQARDWAAGRELTTAVTGRPYLFNLFSHDSPLGDDGANEEERKLVRESARIWDRDDLRVSATCVRVPVLRAHSIALHLELERPISVDAARDAIAAFPGVRVVDDRAAGRFPEPRDAAGIDDVLVGRIRHDAGATDASAGATRDLAMFVCGDQLRKGAALNAVQIAETMLQQAGHLVPQTAGLA
jgi:aspartate-semialdehyde dehydrogenase